MLRPLNRPGRARTADLAVVAATLELGTLRSEDHVCRTQGLSARCAAGEAVAGGRALSCAGTGAKKLAQASRTVPLQDVVIQW
jgi:hypothetical protein